MSASSSSRPFRTELTLPNHADALPIARACVREIVGLTELSGDAAEALVGAAVEACANALDHAFEPGEEGTFTLAGELTPTQVIVSVRDRGIPFATALERANVHAGDASPARLSASGGLAMIREAVDSAEWINRGRVGKELRLV